MATPILNVNTSIVDFLKSRKSPFDFDFRKRLFESTGLAPEKDEFRGTANENIGLLQFLGKAEKNIGTGITPDNIFGVVRTARQSSTTPSPTTATSVVEPPVSQASALDSRSFFSPQLSEKDLANQALKIVTSGVKFPLQREAAQAEKETIQLKGQARKEKLISDLASRGLFFSGKRTKGLEAVDADTVARELGVDRKFALLIASGLESAAQRIAKEAQQGNRDALTSLRSLGFDINPLTGEIEPTISAQRAILAEERSGRGEERAGRAEERAVRGLELREEAAGRAREGTKLSLSEATKLGLPVSLVGTSEDEVTASLSSQSPPFWFRGAYQSKVQATVGETELKTSWEKFRKKLNALRAPDIDNDSFESFLDDLE